MKVNAPRPRRLSLSQMLSGWREAANRVMLAPDVGHLQIAVVAADRIVPIARVTQSREPAPAAADHCPAAHRAQEAPLQRIRSRDIRRPLPTVSQCARCAGGRAAGDRHWVASCRVHSVLALAIEASPGKTNGAGCVSPIDPRREPCQCAPRIHGELLNWASPSGRRVWPMGWTGRAPAPNGYQSRRGALRARGAHAMPSKADTASPRESGRMEIAGTTVASRSHDGLRYICKQSALRRDCRAFRDGRSDRLGGRLRPTLGDG